MPGSSNRLPKGDSTIIWWDALMPVYLQTFVTQPAD